MADRLRFVFFKVTWEFYGMIGRWIEVVLWYTLLAKRAFQLSFLVWKGDALDAMTTLRELHRMSVLVKDVQLLEMTTPILLWTVDEFSQTIFDLSTWEIW